MEKFLEEKMYNDWSSRQSACEAPPEMCIHRTCIHQLLFVLVLEDKFLGKIKPGLVHSLFLGGHLETKLQRFVYRMLGSVKTQANTKRGTTTNKDLVDTGQAKRNCHIPQWIPDVQNGARNLLFDNDEKVNLRNYQNRTSHTRLK